MLLLLAANVRVGIAFDDEPVELEPQPVRATSSENAAIPNLALRRVIERATPDEERGNT